MNIIFISLASSIEKKKNTKFRVGDKICGLH